MRFSFSLRAPPSPSWCLFTSFNSYIEQLVVVVNLYLHVVICIIVLSFIVLHKFKALFFVLIRLFSSVNDKKLWLKHVYNNENALYYVIENAKSVQLRNA